MWRNHFAGLDLTFYSIYAIFLIMINLGQKLYLVRLEKGLTQHDLVLRSGVAQPNLSNIEKGRKDFTVSTLLRLCHALEVSPAGLFEGVPPAPRKGWMTRERVERLARAVWGDPCRLDSDEEAAVRLLRQVVPLTMRSHGQKRIVAAWSELRKKFTDGEIRILTERVRGEGSRRHEKKSD